VRNVCLGFVMLLVCSASLWAAVALFSMTDDPHSIPSPLAHEAKIDPVIPT